MGITFAYELGLKSFLYSTTNELDRENLVQHFQNPQKPNRTKDTGLLRSRGGGNEKKSNLVMAHHLLGAPLVTEKKLV